MLETVNKLKSLDTSIFSTECALLAHKVLDNIVGKTSDFDLVNALLLAIRILLNHCASHWHTSTEEFRIAVITSAKGLITADKRVISGIWSTKPKWALIVKDLTRMETKLNTMLTDANFGPNDVKNEISRMDFIDAKVAELKKE